jgi:hypothetical protein
LKIIKTIRTGKNMKTKVASTLALLFLLTIASTQLVLGQTVSVGVKPGDTFNYSYQVNWDSTDTAATVPSQYAELNTTQFIRITVITVSDSQINVDFTRHFGNGTEKTQNGNIDVDTQILEIPYSQLIIRADANPGEKIYPAGGHAILSDTSTRSYSVGQVDTIQYISVSQETSGSYITTTKETLLITSWVIPEFPAATVLLILLLAIPMLLIAYKKKTISNHKFVAYLKQ